MQALGARVEEQKSGWWSAVNITRSECHGFLQVGHGAWSETHRRDVHFEISVDESMLSRGECCLSLHIEGAAIDEWPEFGSTLVRLVDDYVMLGLIPRKIGCSLSSDLSWRVAKRYLPLSEICSTMFFEKFSRLLLLNSFVTEALNIPSGTVLLRETFCSGTYEKFIQWGGFEKHKGTSAIGGWRHEQGIGRLSSSGLRCDGGSFNYRHGYNICIVSHRSGRLQGLEVDDRVYCCAVLMAPAGRKVRIFGQGRQDAGWRNAFDFEVALIASTEWQPVFLEMDAAPAKEGKEAWSDHGLTAYLCVKPPEDGHIVLDSIEIGFVKK